MHPVGHLNGVCPKPKQEHGSTFLSIKELFAATLRSGWSIAMPSAKLAADKKRVCSTAQVDKFDLVCVPQILCS